MEWIEKNERLATLEFVVKWIAKLEIAFPETSETLLDALTKTVIWLQFKEDEVINSFNRAICTVKRTKITIADIVKEKYESSHGKEGEEQTKEYGKYPGI